MLIKWVESLVGPVDNFRLIWNLNAILIKNLIYLLYIHLIQVVQIDTFQQFLLLLSNVCELVERSAVEFPLISIFFVCIVELEEYK